MTLYDSLAARITCTRPSASPKILPRVIITYGACARGGGRRPGFEATKILPRVIITYGACARGGGGRTGFEATV